MRLTAASLELDISVLHTNDTIAFTLEGVEAPHPVWRLAGTAGTRAESIPLGEFAGQIIDVDARNNGRVDCSDVNDRYGQDAVISPEMMKDCKLNHGDVVAFSLDEKVTQPQVLSPCWKSLSPAQYWMAQSGQGDNLGQMVQAQVEAASAAPAAKRPRQCS